MFTWHISEMNKQVLELAESLILALGDQRIAGKYFKLKERLVEQKIQQMIQEIKDENTKISNDIKYNEIINSCNSLEECYSAYISHLIADFSADVEVESDTSLNDFSSIIKNSIEYSSECITSLKYENEELNEKIKSIDEDHAANLEYFSDKIVEYRDIHEKYQQEGKDRIAQYETNFESIQKQTLATKDENEELMVLNKSFESQYNEKVSNLKQLLSYLDERSKEFEETRKRHQLFVKDLEFKQSQINSLRNTVYSSLNGATSRDIERIKSLEADISMTVQKNDQLQLELNRVTFS